MNMDFDCCPECNCDYSHVEQVRVMYGKDDYTTSQVLDVTAKGLSLKEQKRKLDYRLNGISVVIFLWCENGHTWQREFYTHKGEYSERVIETQNNRR
jgi:hypothetical protein